MGAGGFYRGVAAALRAGYLARPRDGLASLFQPERGEPSAMSNSPHLLVEKRDGVMILTMNRPEKRNALSPEMLVRLARAWYEYRDTDELRVAITPCIGRTRTFCCIQWGVLGGAGVHAQIW